MLGCDGGQTDGGIVAYDAERFQAHVAALHRLLVVLFGRQGTDETDDGGLVGEDADHTAAALDLAVERLSLNASGMGVGWSR